MKLNTLKINKTFCPLPWIHSSVNSIGDIRICCICNHSPFSFLRRLDGTRKNAEKDTIPRNHILYKELRKSMLAGQKHILCSQCWNRELVSLDSNRQVNNSFYPELIKKAIKLTSKDGSIKEKDFPIEYYDLRFGNKCNGKCIICDRANSSMWNNKIIDWSGNLDTPYIKELIKNLQYINKIYITGGEPTIIKNHWNLLQIIIEKNHNNHIHLDYNTNGIVLTKKMLDTWKKFKNVRVGFSVDGINDTFEKIRYPAKWNIVKKNLELFEKYSHSNTFASFAITVCTENILNVIDMFKWYSQLNFKKIRLEPHFNILSSPQILDIRNMNIKEKKIIVKKYEEFYVWLDKYFSDNDITLVKQNFTGIINSMMGG